MKYIYSIAILVVFFNAFGQSKSTLQEANDEILRKHYHNASQLLIAYYNKNEDPSVLPTIGYTLAMHGDSQESISWFEKAQKNGQSLNDEYLIQFANELYVVGRFDEVKELLGDYAGEDESNTIKLLESIKQQKELKSNAECYSPSSISINSPLSEFSVIKYNNGYLLTSNRSFVKKTEEELEYNYFDLYYFETDDFISFSEVKTFDKKFDSRGNDGPISFFANYNKAIVSRNNYHRGIRGITHRGTNEIELFEIDKNENGEWGKLKRLPFDSDDYSSFHPAVSKDGSWMIFASNRPSGYGGSDLYRVELTEGKSSEPKNLGPKINTSENELFPVIHGDSLLVFTSNGHVGLGGLDLYATDLKTPKVKNLGSPFNSNGDDFSWFYLDEKRQIIASNRGKKVGDDELILITQVKKPEDIKPSVIKPKIKIWRVDNFQQSIQAYATSGQVPYDLEYENKMWTLADSTNKVLFESTDQQLENQLNLKFSEAEVITINPIYFGFAEDQSSQDQSINNIVDLMHFYPNLKLKLIGYTDSKGSAQFNKSLGEKRAGFIKNQLTNSGISGSRISIDSEGETMQLYNCEPECTDAQSQKERRVEFVFE